MIDILDPEEIKKVHQLVEENKIEIHDHAEADNIKQNFMFTKNEITSFLKKGKYYYGHELYPEKKERHKRKYCISKRSFFTNNLVLIWFEIFEYLRVIHIQPLNRSTREGKIFYNKS